MVFVGAKGPGRSMAFIKVSRKTHSALPEAGILAWGEAKQQSRVTPYHRCRATASSFRCCLLLKMDQASPQRRTVHCFENHYGQLVQLSSPVCNSLIQKGLLKRTISAQPSWVLVLHLSWWCWMAEQGRGIGRGGTDSTPRHLPCKQYQPVGSRQNPASIARSSSLGPSTSLFLRSHPLAHCTRGGSPRCARSLQTPPQTRRTHKVLSLHTH